MAIARGGQRRVRARHGREHNHGLVAGAEMRRARKREDTETTRGAVCVRGRSRKRRRRKRRKRKEKVFKITRACQKYAPNSPLWCPPNSPPISCRAFCISAFCVFDQPMYSMSRSMKNTARVSGPARPTAVPMKKCRNEMLAMKKKQGQSLVTCTRDWEGYRSGVTLRLYYVT